MIVSPLTRLSLGNLQWCHGDLAALIALKPKSVVCRPPQLVLIYRECFVSLAAVCSLTLTGTNSRLWKCRCVRRHLRLSVMFESLPEAPLPRTHLPPDSLVKLCWCVGSDPLVNNNTCGVIMVTRLFNKNSPTKSCHCFIVACVNMILFILFNILSIHFVAIFSCLSH